MRINRYTSSDRLRRGHRILTLASILFLGLVSSASARITRVVITTVQSPTFGGTPFGNTGQYEKLVGRAFGEVDPSDPRNAVITDIAFAPRNAGGMVEYSMDIYILRPVDSSKGNRRVFFEINNRGNKFAFSSFNNSTSGGNDPTTATDAGNGFLMREGYAIVWSGWDVTVAPGNSRLTMTVPVAKNPDGSSIVGPSLEEFVIDDSTTMTGGLTYAAATLDNSQANLTVRSHYSDAPKPVPTTSWEYVDAQTIRLLPAGTPFQAGSLYEFTYLAKDPLVAGLAFAATRDLAAFLHRAAMDDTGTANPLAGRARYIYSFSLSQPTRFMHDFLYLGFNARRTGPAGLRWNRELDRRGKRRLLQLSLCAACKNPSPAYRPLVSRAQLSLHQPNHFRSGYRTDRRTAEQVR